MIYYLFGHNGLPPWKSWLLAGSAYNNALKGFSIGIFRLCVLLQFYYLQLLLEIQHKRKTSQHTWSFEISIAYFSVAKFHKHSWNDFLFVHIDNLIYSSCWGCHLDFKGPFCWQGQIDEYDLITLGGKFRASHLDFKGPFCWQGQIKEFYLIRPGGKKIDSWKWNFI